MKRSTENEEGVRSAKKIVDLGKILVKEEMRAKYQQISSILKISASDRTEEQQNVLSYSPEMVAKCQMNKRKSDLSKSREAEVIDASEVLDYKCMELAKAINQSQNLVVYTGAGISTAAAIPDYRGPDGVWTRKQKGQELHTLDLSDSDPTVTHMSLAQLMLADKLKYIVSQNCDGLHVRSSIDRNKLSEVHGNMYLEVCDKCEKNREYMRLFDVTERTGVRKHGTGRKCHNCNNELKDTIVHFGEKGHMTSPYNWKEAAAAADSSDMIICLGTSLKVLRKYSCLWNMDRPVKKRASLYIVNLQWTPKDEIAKLKINGRCDEVMVKVMKHLEMSVSGYKRILDPIFHLAVPLRMNELQTTSKKMLSCFWDHSYYLDAGDLINGPKSSEKRLPSDTDNVPSTSDNTDNIKVSGSPGWYGQGYKGRKPKKRRIT